MRLFLISTALVVLPALNAFADTAQEAKAMLEKASLAIKADREVALAQFNKGEAGFRIGDLYPFCTRLPDGLGAASPLAVPAGIDIRSLKDLNGKLFGKELYEGMMKPEGVVTEVTYMFPKPGTTAPAFQKVAYVTRVAPDLGCGVGFYK